MDDLLTSGLEIRLEADVAYYKRVLADPGLLESAVVVHDVVGGDLVDQDGNLLPDPSPRWRTDAAFCVPVGGSRRGGQVGHFSWPEHSQKVIDTLRQHPGFPNPRLVDGNVCWGEEPPAGDGRDPLLGGASRLKFDWDNGHYFGYSLTAIVWQLGRTAAMQIDPDYLRREQRDRGDQIRSWQR